MTVVAAPEAQPRPDPHEPRLGGLRYLPGLDGLRALAVVAVLLYHGDVGFLPGGFLGVDVFFVISGYLITCLLLDDWRRHGEIGLKRFWLRRARRLLPALFLLLGVVSVVAVLFLQDDVASLRGQVLAAIGYVENWYLIFHNDSYFAALGRPPLLRHLWSLAVEEQFYLVWPLLLTAGLKRWGMQNGRLLKAIVLAALASTVLMAVTYEKFTDPSRQYFGTDTRAAPLLVGAALAFLWPPWRLSRSVGRHGSAVLDLSAGLACCGLVASMLGFGQYDATLYRGGFLVVAMLTAVLLAAVVHPASRIAPRLLSGSALVWVGVRSYGIYLWHWPIFMVTRPHDVGFDGLPLLVFRIASTVAAAELSYRFVEAPIRNGALTRLILRYRVAAGVQRMRLVRRLGAAVVVVTVCSLVVVVGFAGAKPPPPPAFAANGPVTIAITTTTLGPAPTTAPLTGRVTMVGASVMLSAQFALSDLLGARLELDAAVSRQAPAGLAVLRDLRDAGQLGESVVVQLGDNGTFRDDQFDEMMSILAGVRRVVVLTVKVDRPWEEQVNGMIAERTPSYRNVVVADWRSYSQAHTDWFVADGIHLTTDGARAYAEFIRRYV